MRRAAEPHADDQGRRARARTLDDAQRSPAEALVLTPAAVGGEESEPDVHAATREFLRAHDAARYNLETARDAFRNMQLALATAEDRREDVEAELRQLKLEVPLKAGRLQTVVDRVTQLRAVLGARRLEMMALADTLGQQ